MTQNDADRLTLSGNPVGAHSGPRTLPEGGSRASGNVSLIAILAVFMFVGYVWSLITATYFEHAVVADLSYLASDRPAGPIPEDWPWTWGVHYFGDFLLPLRQSSFENPYFSTFPNSYPFTVALAFKLLANVPYPIALVGSGLVAFIASLSVLLLLRTVSWSEALIAWIVSIGFSLPFLASLDRGNVAIFLIPIVALWIFAVNRRLWWLVGATAVAGACLKIYPIILIVPLFVERRFRIASISCVSFLGIQFLAASTFSGGIATTLKGFLGDLDAAQPALGARNYSLNGLAMNVFSGTSNLAALEQFLTQFPFLLGAIYCLTIIVLQFCSRLPQALRLYLLASTMVLAMPVSFVYSLCFVGCFALYLFADASWRALPKLAQMLFAVSFVTALTPLVSYGLPEPLSKFPSLGVVAFPITMLMLLSYTLICVILPPPGSTFSVSTLVGDDVHV